MESDSEFKGNVALIPSLDQVSQTMQNAAELISEASYWERAIREGTVDDEEPDQEHCAG